MKKNLILMMLLLTGAVSMNGQIVDEPIMVVTGSVVNTGSLVSKGPIDLRTNTEKNSQINNTATGDIKTPAVTVDAFTLLNNEGNICVGVDCGTGTPSGISGGTQLSGGVFKEKTDNVPTPYNPAWELVPGKNLVVDNKDAMTNLVTWQDAKNACADPWRLPNLGELQFIDQNPLHQDILSGYEELIPESAYWTSTSATDENAWRYRIGVGQTTARKDLAAGYARCVRSI